MRSRFLSLVPILFLGLGTLLVLPGGAAEPVEATKIDKLIDKLGGDDFTERENATADLDAIGVAALPALRKATESKDVEVSRRATDLIAKIEKRAEAARLLAPKKVHLAYRDTPIVEAVEDFAKKSGYPIQLLDPEGKLKDRKISLDTGEVTFWRAFALFCEQGGLKEVDNLGARGFGAVAVPAINVRPVAPRAVPPAPPQKEFQPDGTGVAEFPVQVQIQPLPAIAPAPGAAAIVGFNDGSGNQQLIFADGKELKLPTDDSSAFRVRVMEKPEVFGAADPNQILLGLKVTPEPNLRIVLILNVRVAKALDDQDQNLAQTVRAAPVNAPVGMPPGPGGLFEMFALRQNKPIYLKKGEKASRSLKELKGTIAARVLTPAVPVLTADKIMDAAGKEFKGTDGGRLKIVAVTTNANGQITVKFELDQPDNIVPANPGLAPPGIGVWGNPPPLPPGVLPIPAKPVPGAAPGPGFQAAPPPVQARVQVQIVAQPGGAIIIGPGAAPGVGWVTPSVGQGLSLLDEKGDVIPAVGMNTIMRRNAGGVVREQSMTFQPRKDQVPAKFVFSGSKNVTLDIPFTLKEVTLP